MPRSSALFALGAAAICGLPPLNGFAGEFPLFVGLLRAAAGGPPGAWPWAGLAAPALALIGALALATFVKTCGIAFSGAARSRAAELAHDPGGAMLAPMVVLALACSALGLAPGLVFPLLDAAILCWDRTLGSAAPALASLAPPGWISTVAVLLIGISALVAVLASGWRSGRGTVGTWDCGYVNPTPRMQYVASSFSETLVRLFRWAVQARHSTPDLRGPFPSVQRYQITVPDPVLDRIVGPLVTAADRGLSQVRVLQRGPVQMYLLYVLLAVLVVLLVAR
jgi:hydrogenase-4 component B